MRPSCGIEYAHIYIDEQFGYEHVQSLLVLKQVEESIRADADVRRIVLIDDYNPPKSSYRLNIDSLMRAFADNNATPDVVVAESALEPYCAAVIEMIDSSKLQSSLNRYRQSTERYPCSLFIAAWYLLRLGVFGQPSLATVRGEAKDLYTDSLVTILPNAFQTPENKALEIIKNSKFHQLIGLIKVQYFRTDCFQTTRSTLAAASLQRATNGNAKLQELSRLPCII
jgi:hypothetical protein